ncbi:MAG: hypothetical protein RL757_3379 [Bacteroidota bacterium]|jgi:hypothetical protein
MKSTITIVVLFFTTFFGLQAQTAINGLLTDGQQQPIPSANILLLKSNDSSIVKVGLSEADGKFSFKDVSKGMYLVKIQIIGFSTYVGEKFEVKEKNPTIELPAIVLTEAAKTLETVEIVQAKPFLEARAGKMIVNVANSIAGATGSLSDVLKKVPGLLIVNNQVSMAGKSSVTILIDGKPTDYMDMDALLKELPADQIEKIEVVSQPDARFDAAGTGGILNIIMKKTFSLGTNGSVSLMLGYGKVGKARVNGNVSRRKNGLNTFANASFSNYRTVETLILNRNVGTNRFEQNNFQPSKPYSMNLRGGIDYTFFKKHTLGISAGLNGAQNNRLNETNTSVFSGDGSLVQTFVSRNDIKRLWSNLTAETFYTFEIDTNGTKLEWSANGVRYRRDAESVLSNQILSGAGAYPSRQNVEPGATNIGATKIDFTLPIGKELSFVTGAKWSHVNLDNNISSSVYQNAAWVSDAGFSNHYQYNERIGAAYLNATYKIGRVEWQGGLRYENTRAVGYSVTLDSTQQRQYDGWFPSSSISIKIVKELALQAAYSKRLRRPSYNALNPFVRFMDPLTYERGNPTLQPEITQTSSVAFTWSGQPFLNFEYRNTNNGIQTVTEQNDQTRVTYGYDANLAKITALGGHLFFPLSFVKGMDGFAGVMIYDNRFSSPFLGNELKLQSVSYTGFAQTSYKLNKKWKVEANAWYSKGGLRGLILQGEMFGVDMGIQGKLMDGKLELNLSADNLFYKYFNGTVNYQNQNFNVNVQWEPQVFELSARYRFGNQFLKDKTKAKNAADEEARRASQKN